MRTIPNAVLVDTTDLAAATYYYPLDNPTANARGFLLHEAAELTLSFDISGGVTLTVEWCGHITGRSTVPATADWLDVTLEGMPVDGSAPAASYVDVKDRIVFRLQPGRFRVKVVTADATNAVQVIGYVQYVEQGAATHVPASLPPNAATEATLKKVSGDTAGTNVHSVALEASHVVSAAACKVRSVKALNNSGAPLWLHIFDLAALPANGTVPDRCPIPVPAGEVNGDTWQGSTGFANGCVAALSSTLATLTVIVANDGWFDAEIV